MPDERPVAYAGHHDLANDACHAQVPAVGMQTAAVLVFTSLLSS